MALDVRTAGFFFVQLLVLYAYLSYYGSLRPFLPLLQSFLSGILAGLILLILSSFLSGFFQVFQHDWSVFLKAAVLEKSISYLFLLLLIYQGYRGAGIQRFVSAGVHFGAGFAFLENLVYAFNLTPESIYIRFISSVPMHLATCGIQAFYIGMSRSYSLSRNRARSLVIALVLPVALHGLYDLTCMPEQGWAVYTGPMIVLSVLLFEMLYSRMQTYPENSYLAERSWRFEDWITLEKQPAYAKWILYSSGTRNLPRISYFRFQPSYLRIFFSLVMFFFAILYFVDPDWYRPFVKLNAAYQLAIFGIMPPSFGVIFFVIGSVNPEYFKNKRLRIPVVVDVEMTGPNNERISAISYEISSHAMFILSDDFFSKGDRIQLIMSYHNRTSKPVNCTVREIIQNNAIRYPSGMIVDLEAHQSAYTGYYLRYMVFRVLKGFSLLMNFPGSHKVRSLFVRPLTVMQNEREYRAGECIFREGDRGKQFFLIKKGRIAFFKELEGGNRILLSELGPGSIFGEMALVSDRPRSATAECLTDCVVAVAHRDHLDALIQSNPDFVLGLIQNLIKIIHKNEEELLRLKSYH
jgi:RsiW-degrading membrane proteinase PrsW (M82 family)